MFSKKIKIPTAKRADIIDVTTLIRQAVEESGVDDGVAHVFIQHTSCGIAIQENEPNLLHDIDHFLADLVPEDPEGVAYRHNQLERRPDVPPDEPKNADSHIKSLFVGNSRVVPIQKGRLALGRWQSILLLEMDGPRERELLVMVQGTSTAEDFAKYWVDQREVITQAIGPFLKQEYEAEVLNASGYITQGGKRFRGVLAILVCEALGGNREKALDAAVAVEMLHAATLAKDDVQDGDQYRRGGLSAWMVYGVRRATAMVDVLVPHALSMLEKYGREAVSATIVAWRDVAKGQVKDLFFSAFRGPRGIGLYEEIVTQKTGALFSLAATLGAIASGADPAKRALAQRYGLALGNAFQVMDDLAEKEAGRPSANGFDDWLAQQSGTPAETMSKLMADVEKLGNEFPESPVRQYLVRLPKFTFDAMVAEEQQRRAAAAAGAKETAQNVGSQPAAGSPGQAPGVQPDPAGVAGSAGNESVQP